VRSAIIFKDLHFLIGEEEEHKSDTILVFSTGHPTVKTGKRFF
jgi:hypothetical protein